MAMLQAIGARRSASSEENVMATAINFRMNGEAQDITLSFSSMPWSFRVMPIMISHLGQKVRWIISLATRAWEMRLRDASLSDSPIIP